MVKFHAVDGDDIVSDGDDAFLHHQPGQGRDDDDFMSESDDDDDYRSDDSDDFMSDSDDEDLDEEPYQVHEEDDDDEEWSSFPVNAPPEAATAAISALESAEAPGDGDCCPVCLLQEEDDDARRPWRRVAPCGHRFHAACVEKWLRVKLSCPVCRRCPAAAEVPRRPRPVPDIVEEMLAMGHEEALVFEKSTRWVEFMADDPRNSSGVPPLPLWWPH